ncbi:C-type lectin domain family 10 member A-like isoform X3 [Centroberyx gerrardi]
MEEEVNYASVVFKANKASSPKAKSEEETVYDEVKVQENKTNQTADTPGVLPAGKSSGSCHHVQVVAWCLGILCVILLSAVIALCVYCNLTRDKGILESRNTNLTTENLQLKTEKSDLERRIENMTRERNELNLTRAQWSLDAYCPKKGNSQERQCGPCQEGWIHSPSLSSCYAIVDPDSSGQRTWEEAREDCRGKNSDLVIIGSLEEQKFIYEHSWGSTSETNGYWIGLRNASGSWKWVDGSNLTEEYWIKPPSANAHCAISLQKTLEKPKGWKAVDCTERNRWICEMNALSV